MSGRLQGISIRLSAGDLARLDALAAGFLLDRTNTLRRLIREAAQSDPLPRHGYFTPMACGRTFHPIRLALGGR